MSKKATIIAVVNQKGVEPMKLVLKILALPVLFVVKLICVLENLLTNVVSYVIGILLLVIGGSAIYCIVKALWQSLLILVVLGIATIAAVFLLVWAVMKAENIGESLGGAWKYFSGKSAPRPAGCFPYSSEIQGCC